MIIRPDMHAKRQAIQQSFTDAFLLFGDRVDIISDLLCIDSPVLHPLYNGVFETQWAESSTPDVAGAFNRLTSYFKQKDKSFCWWVNELSPIGLFDALSAQGMSAKSEFVGMFFALHDQIIPEVNNPRITIRPVTHVDELAGWGEPLQHAFEMPDAIFASLMQRLLWVDQHHPKRLEHFLAFLDGQHVGSASMLLGEQTAGMYNLGVFPEYQKQGVGRALKLARLHRARELHYAHAVLQASSKGQPLDLQLGFEACLRFQMMM